ncbi:MAG: hypothetical protein H5U38_02830 [Calditrichaeota bacterium]|nr:hypothetical protein [Calditrichota bacterium]
MRIPEDCREAQAWFKLAGNLYGIAHRRGLDAPRPVNEIREIWDSSLTLLQVLLEALRERFLLWIKILDQLLDKSRPTNEDLQRLSQGVPNNQVTRQHFFDRLKNPEWLDPLRKKGFFKHPPQPVRDEEKGTLRFPPWPEARYLARMAKHKPKLVAEIIQNMGDTDNPAVLSDLVDALLAMPAEISGQLVEKATRWAESPYPYLLLPENLGQLLAHWAKGNRTQEALRVARVLLAVFPDERPMEPGLDELYRPPEPRARFDTWEYEEILQKSYPELVRAAGLPAVELLCDLLDKAIQLSRCCEEDEGPEDYSYIWRPAIEDHSQNLGHTVADALISALRDAAEAVVGCGHATAETVVDALERRHWNVFRRIALHILRVFPEQAANLATERLTNRTLFDDVHLQHEYTLLLRECFPRLSREDQEKILGWIQDGPDLERARETGGEASEDGGIPSREIWQRDWLARIGPEVLPAEWRERYVQLVGKHGEPEHPEFPVSTGSLVGPTSPKSDAELKAMPISEIVEFLKTWRPPENDLREPSREGLGRVLTCVVAQDPGPFAVEAKRFSGLDPTYIRAVLLGLREALRQGRTFDWQPVLELCEWVLRQPREIPGRQRPRMEGDPDWGWTRKAIADLLSTGFEESPAPIAIHLRERVWAVLKPLTDDPDPTPEQERRYGGSNMDPATLAINTVRGRAMHGVVRYGLWVRRHVETESTSEQGSQKGFAEMPEVREVLEAHLDPARDPSLAIRAVYGQRFPWLVLLDTEWARTHAGRIFPQEKEAFFEAAWNSYIALCRPYDNVWEILRPSYRLAVDRIGVRRDDTRWLADPDERLAEHLMVFYWRGKLSLDDPLFVDFWKNAPDALRAHSLAFVGRTFEQTKGGVAAETLDRLKQLWERRLAAAKEAQRPSDFGKEIAAFGWWFVSGKFDIDWALDQLLASTEHVGKTEPTRRVVEALARTAETHSLKSLKSLNLISKGDREGWNLYASRKHVRRILQLAMENPDAKEEAEGLIHYLGSRGFLDFKDLVSR